MKYRPSSLPMLAQCPSFESSGSDFAELGTDRHAALRAHYAGDDSLLDLLDEEDQEGIRWAADYIRANSTEGHPLEWEVKRSWVRPDFTDATGTPDVVNGLTIFDFKWRYRDYSAQMADYALSLIGNSAEKVTVHLLFGANRRAEKLQFDNEACEKILIPILQRAENPTPVACDYCGWCSKQFTCPAKTIPARTVAEGYAEPDMLQLIKDWHPSAMMNDAQQIAFALTIWRKVIKPWGKSVEFHAMEAATKQGLKLPGFELGQTQGKRFIANVQKAYEALGIDAIDFLRACDVRLNTSKKYPDRKGLESIVKEKFSEPSTAAAKRTLNKKLGDLIQRGNSSNKLKSIKSEDDEDDSDESTQSE